MKNIKFSEMKIRLGLSIFGMLLVKLCLCIKSKLGLNTTYGYIEFLLNITKNWLSYKFRRNVVFVYFKGLESLK